MTKNQLNWVNKSHRKCKLDICDKLVHGNDYCKIHYMRWKRHGDPNFVIKIVNPNRKCLTVGCNNKHYCKGFCEPCFNKSKERKEYSKPFQNAYSKSNRKEIKIIVIKHYSKGKMVCKCCNEKEIAFLTIDHINNDGAEHRKQLKDEGNGSQFYRWLIDNNFPSGFQVLCRNCNWGKYINGGKCPHEK